MNKKFALKCTSCGMEFDGFRPWFENRQICPKCGKNRVEAHYFTPYEKLKELILAPKKEKGLWNYFDFLPLNDRNHIAYEAPSEISSNHWTFLEDFAKKHFNIDCTVHVLRNDENYGTGSFKDPGAALAASVLKEAGVKEYIVASTGNVANAFAYYMAKAGISLSAFIPQEALPMNGSGVSCYGQKVFRVKGDYHKAKQLAGEYAQKYNILMTSGNCDPLRVEAKRTAVFDWFRRFPKFPNVYIQALSGGTGPIAIDKALREIENLGLGFNYPKFLMIQPSGCSPMYQAWQKAKAENFPPNWQHDYPIIDKPMTKVPTLATGNPGSYPVVADLVKKSKGEILETQEDKLIAVSRWVAYHQVVNIGPAAATAVSGYIDALKNQCIQNGDVVLLNIGEGAGRAPEFCTEMNYTEELVGNIEECARFCREDLAENLEKAIL